MALGNNFCRFIIAAIAVIVLLVITIVVGAVVTRKRAHKYEVAFQVTIASLTKFDFSNNNTFLDYNLSLTLNLRNSVPLHYNYSQLVAAAVVNNQTLNDVPVNVSKPFYLDAKANGSFPALLSGNRSVAPVSFNFNNVSRLFDIVLKVNSSSLIAELKKATFKEAYACYLKVPLMNSNGTSSAGDLSFQATKCKKLLSRLM